jgi:zinc transport system ATP-binding protein
MRQRSNLYFFQLLFSVDTSSIISIHHLCFSYDAREILHDVSLDIANGMFAAMVGPNGGGKTTLLRLILGLLTPRHGSIKVFGSEPSTVRSQIAYVPQAILFDPKFPASALDIVLMGRVERHLFGGYSRQDRDIAMKRLEDVGLKDYANHSFSELSGGQRQRVIIAQALASESRLLLLDEPAANLDQENATTLFDLLGKLNENVTILMVSHNLTLVSKYVSHVICVNQTVDMHRIEDIRSATDDLTGWVHLIHQACPVTSGKKTDEQNHPHHH